IFLALRSPWPGRLPFQGWVIVIALGFFLALGNLAILAAFARGGKASIISPLGGLYPVISVPVAVFWFGERISTRECIAIGTALLSVVALSCEKRKATE